MDPLPKRKPLIDRVRNGESHDAIRWELESTGEYDGPAILRRLATLPIRRPLWWERGISVLLGFVWCVLLLAVLATLIFGGPLALSDVLTFLITAVIAFHVVRGNGSAYGPGIVWLLLQIGLGWWEALTMPAADVYPSLLPETIWLSVFFLLVVGGMEMLKDRLFPHVTFWGRHRDSSEPRVPLF